MSDNIIECIDTQVADPKYRSLYEQYYPEYYDQNESSDRSEFHFINFALKQDGPPPKGHKNLSKIDGLVKKLYGKS